MSDGDGKGGGDRGGGKGGGKGGPRGGGRRPGGPGRRDGRPGGSGPGGGPGAGRGRGDRRAAKRPPPRRERKREEPQRAVEEPVSPPIGARLAGVEELEIEIEKLVAGGEGLGRWQGVPIFVPRSAPGDRLRVRVVERQADYGRGEIVEVLSPGEGRREPPCPYFERCGGCDLQHLEDDVQVRHKAAAVIETLRRIGRLDPPTPRVVVGAAWGYRLRTQLHVGPAVTGEGEAAEAGAGAGGVAVGPAVGYFARGSHDLVPVAACPILVPALESLLPGLPHRLAEAGRVPSRLDLAAGGAADEYTSAPVVEGLPHGEVTLSVAGVGGFPPGGGDFTYGYDARCFFQAHRGLVGRLVEAALGEADWTGETAFDLYAGVGLFTLPLARRYARVVAVEGDAVAARYARLNARRNRAPGVEVEHRVLDSWIEALPAGADRVVVDPPRGGLGKKVRRVLAERPAERLTYVSCHAATLARDLRQLVVHGPYAVESLTLLDLFPQSGHMEAVVQLARNPVP